MQSIIVKLGGSVITYKHRLIGKINHDVLKNIANELNFIISKDVRVILVHGAGSYGHPLASLIKKTGKNIENGLVEIEMQMKNLNLQICDSLLNHKIKAYPYQLYPGNVEINTQECKIDVLRTSEIINLWNRGIVPVFYGFASLSNNDLCIISGDEIVKSVFESLNIDKIIFLTDVDGLYNKDPKKHKDAKLIKEVKINNILCDNINLGDKITDVTGEIYNKLCMLKSLKKGKAIITNGTKKGRLIDAVFNEKYGTKIMIGGE